MPVFRCLGAFVFMVFGLFEVCGTIYREKRTREKGEEHITQEKNNMTISKQTRKTMTSKIVKVGREMREDERTKNKTRK